MIDSKPIIAANWKMHKTPQEAHQFARQLSTKALNLKGVKFILAPSATAIYNVNEVLKDTDVDVAGQNMHFAEQGAFTGENSVAMLQACGCEWVILGHSERRHVFGESDEMIAQKVDAGLKAEIGVIFCIGEKLEERESGRIDEVLRRQLNVGLKGLDSFPIDRVLIAYEPVWAIGTGVVATSQQAGEAHAKVREILAEQFSDLAVDDVKILYGGSVKSANAAELIKTAGIDGFLIGGAALDVNEYCSIADIAQNEV